MQWFCELWQWHWLQGLFLWGCTTPIQLGGSSFVEFITAFNLGVKALDFLRGPVKGLCKDEAENLAGWIRKRLEQGPPEHVAQSLRDELGLLDAAPRDEDSARVEDVCAADFRFCNRTSWAFVGWGVGALYFNFQHPLHLVLATVWPTFYVVILLRVKLPYWRRQFCFEAMEFFRKRASKSNGDRPIETIKTGQQRLRASLDEKPKVEKPADKPTDRIE